MIPVVYVDYQLVILQKVISFESGAMGNAKITQCPRQVLCEWNKRISAHGEYRDSVCVCVRACVCACDCLCKCH